VFTAEKASLTERSWALIILAGVAAVVWWASESRRRRGRGRWEP
jgi:hypothetical protein